MCIRDSLVAFPPAGWQLYPFPVLVKVINLAALGKPFPMFVHCPHSEQDMGVRIVSVSYTHLDVYKRQVVTCVTGVMLPEGAQLAEMVSA